MKSDTRQSIVGAARKLFATWGYDGASMDGIASEASVTKVTVYRHFESKEALFSAALQSLFDELPAPGIVVVETQGPLRERLISIAENILALGTGQLMIKLHRMLALPRDSAPATAADIWDRNFQPYHDAMQRLLTVESERGVLEIPDVEAAATQFLSLIAGQPMVRLFLTGAPIHEWVTTDKHVADAVDLFLRGYSDCKN